MRAVVQRANNADVKVDGKIVGEINGGLQIGRASCRERV